MSKGKVVIVGGGIIGQAHALTALEQGWSVTLLERDGRALGASVRNFGTLWPIGCVAGAEREQALFGVKRWKEMAAQAGFWIKPQGSLTLAYREEAWAVLQEFSRTSSFQQGFEMLDATEIKRRFPSANPDGLRGGFFSAAEAVVHPPSALAALAKLVEARGAEVKFGSPVAKILDGAVETSDGQRFEFDELLIAAGDEMRAFFPTELAAAGLTRCRLQMMRTVPQPDSFDLGAVFVSDLTLCHYPAFRDCPSAGKLRARLQAELPQHHKWGVHAIVAQHPDGSIVLGDSHEYASDFSPETYMDVDELILEAVRKFVCLPETGIAARWQGIYLKSTLGQTQVILNPRKRVTMVTAMGGLGMTLSWGLARKTVEGWSRREVTH
jgi:FAD dependent oxidoreductase TIGR03364